LTPATGGHGRGWESHSGKPVGVGTAIPRLAGNFSYRIFLGEAIRDRPFSCGGPHANHAGPRCPPSRQRRLFLKAVSDCLNWFRGLIRPKRRKRGDYFPLLSGPCKATLTIFLPAPPSPSPRLRVCRVPCVVRRASCVVRRASCLVCRVWSRG
jgi:hypothetical protein